MFSLTLASKWRSLVVRPPRLRDIENENENEKLKSIVATVWLSSGGHIKCVARLSVHVERHGEASTKQRHEVRSSRVRASHFTAGDMWD
jgi:hypothetical protein